VNFAAIKPLIDVKGNVHKYHNGIILKEERNSKIIHNPKNTENIIYALFIFGSDMLRVSIIPTQVEIPDTR
jgi:hypothetical protein